MQLCRIYISIGYSIQIAKNRLLKALAYSKIGFVHELFPGTELLTTAVASYIATVAIQ